MAININIPSQVKTYADFATLPVSGEDKTIYITEDDNKTYRWDGATYVEISAGGSGGLTVGTSPITSGTAGRILFEGAGNVLQESSNLFWDNTNGRLGIGTSSPASSLHVNGAVTIGAIGVSGWQFSSNTLTLIQNAFIGVDIAGGRQFSISNTVFSTTYFRVAPTTGNVLINTTTDAGYKLDVNGTARVSGNLTADNVNVNTVRASAFNNNNNTQTVFFSSAFTNTARFTGAVSMGTTSEPLASAQLDVNSTTRGFLPPRMTTTQKNAIASPATGLMVYDNTLNRPCFYDGTTWITL